MRDNRDLAIARAAGTDRDDITDLIYAHIAEAKIAQALGEGGGARGFLEGRGRDFIQFDHGCQRVAAIALEPVNRGFDRGVGEDGRQQGAVLG